MAHNAAAKASYEFKDVVKAAQRSERHGCPELLVESLSLGQ